ncbi:hypothetical protein ABNC96_07145 [Paenibacillus larvae]|nr:hypothetical protein [Paenibacillus larvae]MDR5583680.1 hypothetical protein [Paenibacillus larvae]
MRKALLEELLGDLADAGQKGNRDSGLRQAGLRSGEPEGEVT